MPIDVKDATAATVEVPLLSDTGIPATAGQKTMAGSLGVVLASDHSDVKVTLDSESVAVTGPVTDAQLRAADVKVTLDGETVAVASIAAGDNNIGNVDIASAPTLTKGTQGSTGFSVQNLKDAGRVNLVFWATAVAAGTTGTETAITLERRPDQGAGSSAASFVITSGKRFRITSIMFATRGHNTATAQVTTFKLRINTAGAVGTTSTPIVIQARCATPATANSWDRLIVPIGDGIEFLGDGTAQFGVTAAATYTTNAPTWDVLITGFEY